MKELKRLYFEIFGFILGLFLIGLVRADLPPSPPEYLLNPLVLFIILAIIILIIVLIYLIKKKYSRQVEKKVKKKPSKKSSKK
jgi:hypothetical protein